MIWVYHLTAFLSAFLLFQIQPITSKAVLPLFGGSYIVWSSCMVFYQTILLAGYFYAHVVQRRFKVLSYGRLHCILIFLPLFFFPFQFYAHSHLSGLLPLTMAVFAILTFSVGLPVFMLSTTSLVLQRWLANSELSQRKNPYVLYAASNAGSIAALLTYPTIAEPLADISMQGNLWWGGYALLAVLYLICLPRKKKENALQDKTQTIQSPGSRPALSVMSKWFLLSAAPSAAFVATTNVLTFDMAAVPLLWVLPLSIFLFAFVLAFKTKPWNPPILRPLLKWSVITGMVAFLLTQMQYTLPWQAALPLYLLVLFVLCISCANQLHTVRPIEERYLTDYYLLIALGGVSGSMLVTWIIPLMTNSLLEYPLSFVLVLLAITQKKTKPGTSGASWATLTAWAATACFSVTVMPIIMQKVFGAGSDLQWLKIMLVAFPFAISLLAVSHRKTGFALTVAVSTLFMSHTQILMLGGRNVTQIRNYYGIYRIYEKDGLKYLQHGTTQHGRQYTTGVLKSTPIGYYHPSTPLASVLECDKLKFKKPAMVGLGTGALAAYMGTGQTLHIYELDPDNIPIAENHFTYLDLARQKGADIHFVIGDGRIKLREKPANSHDLLVIDAFNSGSIPVHLLTVDALDEYMRVVSDNGIVIFHVSNRFLRLEPVIYSNAKALGLFVCHKLYEKNSPDTETTQLVAVSRSKAVHEIMTKELDWRPSPPGALPEPWTDQYCNIFSALRPITD